MRTKALTEGALSVVLRALYRPNRLVCLVALCTGLRVSDVLAIRTEQLGKTKFTVREQKTGKRKVVRLPVWLRDELQKSAGRFFVFENRLDPRRSRTRQAVWADLRRVAKLYGVKSMRGLAPHSMRKTYAVDLRKQGFTAEQIKKALNHEDLGVTMLYALAEVIDID